MSINDNLFQQAMQTYEHWFLQFDFPDEEGKPYKTSGGAMKTDDGSKQKIPQSWNYGTLADLFTICNGKDHSRLASGKHPVYGSGGVMRYVDDSLFTGESVLIPRKGTLNNIIYVNDSFWTVDTMFFTKMKKPRTAIYTFFAVRMYDFSKFNSGTGVPSMTSSLIYSLKTLIPCPSILERFDTLVKPLFETIKNNDEENKNLRSLRNWLLPMLMTGQATIEG